MLAFAYVTMNQNVGYRMSGSSNPNQDNQNENVHRGKRGTVSPRKKDTKASKKIIFLNDDIINIIKSKADLCQF